jgi:hypothetical protein
MFGAPQSKELSLKLNLGCGHRPKPGWVNVDKYPPAEQLQDLEILPWPWADNSVEEVLLCHVLEHLGQSPNVFLKIMQELYRICRNGAVITIIVPHPRHDFFLNDPTHVRPITSEILSFFSKAQCEDWIKRGVANTPLALQLGVDFEMTGMQLVPDSRMTGKSNDQIVEAIIGQNNVIAEMTFTLTVRK